MLGVSGPLADVRGPQAVRDQRFDRLADQLAGQVAVHVLGAPVGQHDHAVLICQDHPVVQGVDQSPQHCWSDPRRPSAAPRQDRGLALPPAWSWRQRDDTGHPGGNGRLCGRVDRDQPVQPAGIQDPPHGRGGDRHPQLPAAHRGTLAGAQQCVRTAGLARNRPGHVRDQHPGALVDQVQQLLADRPGVRRADVLRQRHHRLVPGPAYRARAVRHGGHQRIPHGQGAAKWRRWGAWVMTGASLQHLTLSSGIRGQAEVAWPAGRLGLSDRHIGPACG